MKPNAMTKNKDKFETDLELFRDLINKSNDAIFVNDPLTGLFIFVNDKACSSLGYDRQELLKMKVMDIEAIFPDNFSWETHVDELRQRGSHILEGIHKRKNCTTFPVEINVSYMVLNTREYMVAVVRDITERKEAAEAMRIREKQLAESQRIAHIGSWEHNLTTGQVFWSDELFRLFGLDPMTDPADFKMFFDMVHPDDRAALKTAIDKTVRTGKHFNIDYRFILKNGSTRVLHAQAELIHDDTGTQVILSGTGQDITERKKAEEAKDRLLKAISASTEGIAITDDKDRFVYVNAAHARIYGCLQDELIGKTWRDTVTPELEALIERDLPKTLHNRAVGIWSGECPALRKDGTILPAEITATSRWDEAGNYVGHICIVRDISERKRAEETLSRSEERYRNLFEDSPISLWEEDFSYLQEYFNALRSSGITDFRAYFADHPEEVYKCMGLVKIISVNKATLGLYEAPDQATLLQDISRVFTAQSLESFREILVALAGGTRTYECEAINQTLTGRKIKVLLRWSLLPWTAQGSHALVSIVDITDRTEAEEKLRRSEEFIRNILDTVDEGFIVIDRDFRILTANNAYCTMVGESCDSVIGRRCYEISHKTLKPCYEEGEECAVRHAFETGEPHTVLHKHPGAKGSVLYVETRAFPIKDSTGAVISVIETVNNITEKHRLEEGRLKTQKLEAIGVLAGGIAHDFNNLLQGVFGYISMAKMTLDQREHSLAMLEQAEKALHMSVNLTTQLLTFSKGGKPLKKKIPLRSVIEDSVKFALSGSRIDYSIQVEEGLRMVEADGGQIGQVIQNLVLNAEQAMPMGGTITIMARNVGSGRKGLSQVLTQGNYVEISVKDSGIGIPQQYLPKIFDPYFTTKDKGNGLGLATSYSIIKNHSGLIDVKSKLGEGTTFFVYLPALEALETLAVTVPADIRALRKGRILLMDDEDIVRNIAGVMIRSLGHEVELAENGKEAIDKYRESMRSGRQFDIVIMDLTIRGGMGGEEAIKVLLEIDPDIKAIVSSGYTESSAISEYGALGFKACLTKPYDIVSLNGTLNSLLD